MKKVIPTAFGLAIFGGLYLAIAYVNPYEGSIPLSELVLQLSGSRGKFELGASITELVAFSMRMIPSYIFEVFFGIVLYRQFCTASIYVFSRYPRRLNWYFSEVSTIGGAVFLYQLISLLTILLVTKVRYQVQIDSAGVILLAYHFLIQVVWIYAMTLSINLLAILIGSSSSFLTIVGLQIICTTLLTSVDKIRKLFNSTIIQELVLRINPISRLVLGWHSSRIEAVNRVLDPPYSGLDLNSSLLYIFLFGVTVLIAGGILVERHDLLISDLEKGVM